MAVTIRTAAIGDAEPLMAYAARLFSEGLPGIFRRDPPTFEQEVEFIRSRVGPDGCTLMVALDEAGSIVGLLDFMREPLDEQAHCGTFGISVDRDHRGEGVGTALLEALFAWAPEHGITRIQAYAWATNPRAIELYERHGFEREGVLRRSLLRDGCYIDTIALAKLL